MMVELKRAPVLAPITRDRADTRIQREPPKPKASIPITDIEAVVGIAERLYHLPGGKNGNGIVGQTCARLRKWLEGLK